MRGADRPRLPEQKEELDSLFAELLALETPESRLYKAPGPG